MSATYYLHLTPLRNIFEVPEYEDTMRPPIDWWTPTRMVDAVIYQSIDLGVCGPIHQEEIPVCDTLMWAWRLGFVPRVPWGSDDEPFGPRCANNFTTTPLRRLETLEDNE